MVDSFWVEAHLGADWARFGGVIRLRGKRLVIKLFIQCYNAFSDAKEARVFVPVFATNVGACQQLLDQA
jgi:hypothetical protein